MKNKILALIIIAFACTSSCTKDEEKSAANTYYTDINLSGTAQDFATINSAIKNNILIYTTGYSHNYDRYAATMNYFASNGMWDTSDSSYGKLRFLPTNGQQLHAIRFVDGNTLIDYWGCLWDPDRVPSGYEIIGRIYTGDIFGTLVYCASPLYYTYVKEGNKIIVSNGDIYTKTNSGFIKDGSSRTFIKYNPNETL